MKSFKKQVPHDGTTVDIEVRMWTVRERDEVEREFGTPGSRYLNGLIGMISQGKPVPATLGLMNELIAKEVERLNTIGIRQTVRTIQKCVASAPFSLEEEDLLSMPQDEFSALAEAVQSVIWGVEDRTLLLKEELSKVLRGKDLEKAHAVVDNVFSGRAEKNA